MTDLVGTISEIRLFAGNKPPKNWAFCQGQLLPVSQYKMLYSIIGNIYGGDQQNFGLPDLRGRSAIGAGEGVGLDTVGLAQKLGQAQVTLSVDQLPPHSHYIEGQAGAGNEQNPQDNYCADEGHAPSMLYSDTSNASMGATSETGSGEPYWNYQESVGLNYIICLDGNYPSHQ